MKRLLTAGLLVAALASPAGAAAQAEGPGILLSEARLDAAGRSLDAKLSVQGLPPGSGLDARSITATVAGRTLPITTEVAAVTAARTPRVLVVVDTSGSMAGEPMADAKQAVSEFVASAPSDIEIGLLGFSSEPRLLVAPTTKRSRVIGAVADLRAQGETSLYDAVLAGLQALGTEGDRRLVVLSDGADTRSAAALPQVLDRARSSGVVVDAVGFKTDEAVTDVLKQVAASGRGKVRRAENASDLSTALAATAREYATALDVHVLLPDDLRGYTDLVVSATSPAGPLSATTTLALPGETPASSESWWGTRTALLAGLLSLAAGLLLGSLVLLPNGRRDRRRVQEVLGRYTTAPAPAKEDLRTASPVTRTALAVAGKVVEKRNLQDRFNRRLERAAIAMTPAEWLLMQAGVAVVLTLLLVLLGGNPAVALLLGVVVAVVVPRLVLAVRGSRRRSAFEDKLPDTLQTTAASLAAGYSLAQALDGVVREGSEPMATEIGRALAESRLGVPVETTLQGVADRMDSTDFAWVVMAIRVQREVGGNLAGILTTVCATMRERAGLRRQVRALTAEGRLSAYLLLALPLCLAGYMLLVRREYIEPLYTTGMGLAMIAVALVMMIVGSVVMNRIVKVEV